MRVALLLATTLLALAACAPATPPAQNPESGSVMERGTIRVVGSLPVDARVMLERPSGNALRIEGPLAGELRSLAGAEVEVTGNASKGGLVATRYEVRAVDGAPVVFGIVEAAPGGGLQLRTGGGEVVRLDGASGLRAGQKAWVQGPSVLQVQSYGVVRQ